MINILEFYLTLSLAFTTGSAPGFRNCFDEGSACDPESDALNQ